MKRSELGKIARLLKESLDEEKMWGEAEVLLRKMKVRLEQKQNQNKNQVKVEVKVKNDNSTAPEPSVQGGTALEEYRKEICSCQKCPLGKTRINFVFGVGDPRATLMFVGEGPGYDEDRKGEPFVGKAGQLLTKIIEAMGLKRQDVYIANIVKCHPMVDPVNPEKRGNDRPPSAEEIAACLPYLQKQIELIKPKFICALGTWAAKTLLETETGISKLRGRFFDYKGIRLMPTYHPAALLRNPALKKDVWEDMKMIMAAMKENS